MKLWQDRGVAHGKWTVCPLELYGCGQLLNLAGRTIAHCWNLLISSRKFIQYFHLSITNRLIECMVLNAISILFHLYHRSQCTCSCFPEVHLTSILHNILSKPLAAFPRNHRQNNRLFCRNDYRQSLERLSDWTSDLPTCSQVLYATKWAGRGSANYKEEFNPWSV